MATLGAVSQSFLLGFEGDVRQSGREASEAFPSQQALVFGPGKASLGGLSPSPFLWISKVTLGSPAARLPWRHRLRRARSMLQPTRRRRSPWLQPTSPSAMRSVRRVHSRSPWLRPRAEEKKKVECAWLLLLSYASGLLASSSDSQSSTLVASGVLALRALLLCFARAPALLTRPPAETEHKKQKKARCAWLLLLSNPSSLLASLALYSLPSYHSGSSALVASGVFGLEAVHRPACC